MPEKAFDLSERDVKRLDGVHPDLIRVLRRLATFTTVPFFVVEGVRTVKRQRELVAKGASKTMKSRHLQGFAVDIAPVKDSWAWPQYYRLAPLVKQAAKLEGVPVEWGGDWWSFKDGPHWQLPHSKYPDKV